MDWKFSATATARFPKKAGVARYGEPEEIPELMAFVVAAARWMIAPASQRNERPRRDRAVRIRCTFFSKRCHADTRDLDQLALGPTIGKLGFRSKAIRCNQAGLF